MKINISEYFPVSASEIDEFEKSIGASIKPSCDSGFERLMESKLANEKLLSFKDGKTKPSTFGMLVEILAKAMGKNRFRFAGELQTEPSIWNKVILNQTRPDTLPSRVYVALAKAYDISFEVLKCSIEGSIKHSQSGISNSGAVFARSDQKTTNQSDVNSAMYELLQKAGRTSDTIDSKTNAFLKEIESCMKMKN